MSKLPPYSTYPYRVAADKSRIMVPQAMSRGNVLTFTPRGFNQVLNVKFPDSRLAVCKKCKKNFKTRESCRVRCGHSTAPWATAYVCFTLDDSCTDAEGNFVDKPLTVRMSNWQPLCLKKDFDDKTPVCAQCKKTNRTRTFCRERHKHRHLPWSTVYVILSALDATDPSTIVAAPSELANEDEQEEIETSVLKKPNENEESRTVEKEQEVEENKVDDETDNIYAIEPSRTFLAQVSCKSNTIHWLDQIDGELSPVTTEIEVKALNEAIRNPAHPDMHGMMPPHPYLQIMSPQQHHHYFHQQQQHFAAWYAQYGQPMMMMPPPMMTTGQMPGPTPPPMGMSLETNSGNDDMDHNGEVEGDPLEGDHVQADHNERPISDFDANAAPNSPDAQAQWHAHMMFQQQMYHQHFLAHQHYMTQQAHQQYMAHQSPSQNDHENLGVEGDEDQHDILGTEDTPDRELKQQRIEPTPIDHTAIEPAGIDETIKEEHV